jgi:NTP pyrophosphatase (non-canonical NTP hydrolase)
MKKNELSLNEYQTWVASMWTGSKKKLTLADDFVMSLGLPGEAGEVTELLKKAQRDKKSVLKVNKKKLIKELGDVQYYLMMICYRHGIEAQEIIRANVKKLKARYKNRR